MKLLNEDNKSCIKGSTLSLESIALGDGRKLGGGNSNIYVIFTPILGEDEPILTGIFFK